MVMTRATPAHSAGPRRARRWRVLLATAAAAATAILAGGVLFNVYTPTNAPVVRDRDEDLEEHDFEATVLVTAAGFAPATVKVRPRTRVYFENTDGAAHKLVADPTPPDPSFASTAELPIGGGHGYTFITAGTYSFHDANNPNLRGEIIVVEAAEG
jgi:plastocyanin